MNELFKFLSSGYVQCNCTRPTEILKNKAGIQNIYKYNFQKFQKSIKKQTFIIFFSNLQDAFFRMFDKKGFCVLVQKHILKSIKETVIYYKSKLRMRSFVNFKLYFLCSLHVCILVLVWEVSWIYKNLTFIIIYREKNKHKVVHTFSSWIVQL